VHEIEPPAKSDVADKSVNFMCHMKISWYTKKKMVRKVISACN